MRVNVFTASTDALSSLRNRGHPDRIDEACLKADLAQDIKIGDCHTSSYPSKRSS